MNLLSPRTLGTKRKSYTPPKKRSKRNVVPLRGLVVGKWQRRLGQKSPELSITGECEQSRSQDANPEGQREASRRGLRTRGCGKSWVSVCQRVLEFIGTGAWKNEAIYLPKGKIIQGRAKGIEIG